ncbi:MAG: UDP-N-acetylmuramoyl-L-alanyl-D-glutamate--2,6-diaminopimelate ligase [Firmicutes bacterium ADurb.Bin193]|nr:MAG: UDP-N-acetylmuramoyl-L-alanyl-D-glutamate--2,6-diaminopimelate ligase [Firmicutes bacterium ADurb.Bin193]
MNINKLVNTDLDIEVSGISYDSRNTKPGDVFVAIKGFVSDGHDYALAAQENGAVCVVCEHAIDGVSIPCIVVNNTREALAYMSHRFYGNPSSAFKLIGVTGTNGKTTVTYLIKDILEQAGKKVGLIGTNQNMIGYTPLETHHTTPESLELAALFRQMADEGCEYVVMEVSSHSLELHRVDVCEFVACVFTNLTQDHLDFHKTMENYKNAKKKLFNHCKYGIINTDDPSGEDMVKDAPCKVYSYGIYSGEIRASEITESVKGAMFSCLDMNISLGIPGHFTVYNALAAIGVAISLGISHADIEKALSNAKGVKGRLELVPTGRDFSIIIDYAHTPDGLLNVLESARRFTTGRLVVLFGCGGDRDRTKRPLMGKIAGELADYCIITSDNPRSEEPAAIIRDILSGMNNATAEYIVVENRREAIEVAIRHAMPGDVIILAGKGHETYQILADKTIHFDEREIVYEILNNE